MLFSFLHFLSPFLYGRSFLGEAGLHAYFCVIHLNSSSRKFDQDVPGFQVDNDSYRDMIATGLNRCVWKLEKKTKKGHRKKNPHGQNTLASASSTSKTHHVKFFVLFLSFFLTPSNPSFLVHIFPFMNSGYNPETRKITRKLILPATSKSLFHLPLGGISSYQIFKIPRFPLQFVRYNQNHGSHPCLPDLTWPELDLIWSHPICSASTPPMLWIMSDPMNEITYFSKGAQPHLSGFPHYLVPRCDCFGWTNHHHDCHLFLGCTCLLDSLQIPGGIKFSTGQRNGPHGIGEWHHRKRKEGWRGLRKELFSSPFCLNFVFSFVPHLLIITCPLPTTSPDPLNRGGKE